MSAKVCSYSFGKALAQGRSAALVRGRCPAQMKRVTKRMANIKQSATEFFTDLNDGIQTTDVANQFDTKWVMEELTNTEELGKRGELLFAGQMVLILLVFVPPFDLGILSRLIGLVTAVGGLAICAAGAKSLGKNLTPLPAPRAGGGSLVQDGMYKYMRHPMYTGLILLTTGVAATSADSTRMMLALGLATLLTYKSEKEEQGLIAVYGEAYRTYQSKVKRFGFL